MRRNPGGKVTNPERKYVRNFASDASASIPETPRTAVNTNANEYILTTNSESILIELFV